MLTVQKSTVPLLRVMLLLVHLLLILRAQLKDVPIGAENVTPTRIRSPNPVAESTESTQQRLRYLGQVHPQILLVSRFNRSQLYLIDTGSSPPPHPSSVIGIIMSLKTPMFPWKVELPAAVVERPTTPAPVVWDEETAASPQPLPPSALPSPPP